MGIVQKEALRVTIVSYVGILLGYLNKIVLFVLLLSPEEVGLINLILAVGGLFAQVSNLGVYNTTWKFFPFFKNDKNNHHGFLTLNFLIVFTGIILSTILVIVFQGAISGFYIERSASFVHYYYWIIPCGIGFVLYRFLDSYLRALYKNVFSAIANDLILRIITTGILVLKAFDVIDFGQFLIAICLSQLIPALLLVVYMKGIKEWHFSVKGIQIRKRFKKIIISYSLFTYSNSLGAILVVTIDAMMIASFLGLGETGIYTIILYLIRALMVPYSSIMRVSSPLVAQHWKNRDMKAMNSLYKKVSSVNLVIGLFLFLGVWTSREELFSFLPDYYSSGIYVFMVLMIGRLIDMYAGVNGTILLTSKKYKYDILLTISLFILVVVLNVIMIPKWGMIGAAMSTSIAWFGYNAARLILVWKFYKVHPFEKSQLIVMVLFAISLLGMEFLDLDLANRWLNIAVKSMLVVTTFPVLIYIFKIERETVNYVDKVLAVVKKKRS